MVATCNRPIRKDKGGHQTTKQQKPERAKQNLGQLCSRAMPTSANTKVVVYMHVFCMHPSPITYIVEIEVGLLDLVSPSSSRKLFLQVSPHVQVSPRNFSEQASLRSRKTWVAQTKQNLYFPDSRYRGTISTGPIWTPDCRIGLSMKPSMSETSGKNCQTNIGCALHKQHIDMFPGFKIQHILHKLWIQDPSFLRLYLEYRGIYWSTIAPKSPPNILDLGPGSKYRI